MMSQQYDFIFKILIVGSTSVGKSSLLLRFSQNTFSENFNPTIGVDFKIKTVDLQGSLIKLQMWDTAGQQRFKTIISSYYKGAQGLIFIFDITNRDSFKDIEHWLSQADKYCNSQNIKILIGNKVDQQPNRQVRYDQAKCFAQSHGMMYLQTSAKDDRNVQNAFMKLTKQLKQKKIKRPDGRNKQPLLELKPNKPKPKTFFDFCKII